MTDFKLDIDYPYDPPSPEILRGKPARLSYSQNLLKYRHYGLIITKMIEAAIKMEGDEQRILIEQIANQMKKLYLAWNKDSVEDEKIFKDLEEMSDYKLKVPSGLKLGEIRVQTAKKKRKKK
jgi:predicted DNA-binding protein